MATKGKTRGPQKAKYVNKSEKDDAKYATRRKKTAKNLGADKK